MIKKYITIRDSMLKWYFCYGCYNVWVGKLLDKNEQYQSHYLGKVILMFCLVCVCETWGMGGCTCHSTHVKVRRQLYGVSSDVSSYMGCRDQTHIITDHQSTATHCASH